MNATKKILLFVIVFLSFSFAQKCTFNTTSGYFYDFSRMKLYGDITEVTNKGRYYYQVCSDLKTHCSSFHSSVCLLTANGIDINAGRTDSALWSPVDPKQPESGVSIVYSNGDVCGNHHGSIFSRKTLVNLHCHDFTSQGNLHKEESMITSIDDSDDCTTIVNISSSFACGTKIKNASPCGQKLTEATCFNAQNEDCSCAWCDGQCVGKFEICAGKWSSGCEVVIRSNSIFVFIVPVVIVLLMLCLCVCVCVKKRRYNKISRIRHNLQLPTHNRKFVQEMAMEPLMQSEMQMDHPVPQFVYVQVPMHNSDQQNPPYFAPQPFFLAPQFVQPTEEMRQ